jgi:hypothetical protein
MATVGILVRFIAFAPWRRKVKDPLKNNFGILAGCGYSCERQAASTYKQYACFAFLRSLVLAAPKHPIYF